MDWKPGGRNVYRWGSSLSTFSRSCGFLSLTQLVCVRQVDQRRDEDVCHLYVTRSRLSVQFSLLQPQRLLLSDELQRSVTPVLLSSVSLYMEKGLKYYFHIFHKKVQAFHIILSWITRKMKVIHKCVIKYKVMSRMNYVNELIFYHYFYICRGTSSAEQPGIYQPDIQHQYAHHASRLHPTLRLQ